jgi:hypothetical protein
MQAVQHARPTSPLYVASCRGIDRLLATLPSATPLVVLLLLLDQAGEARLRSGQLGRQALLLGLLLLQLDIRLRQLRLHALQVDLQVPLLLQAISRGGAFA